MVTAPSGGKTAQVMADTSVGVLGVGSPGNAAWRLQMEQPGDPGNCHKPGILLELDFWSLQRYVGRAANPKYPCIRLLPRLLLGLFYYSLFCWPNLLGAFKASNHRGCVSLEKV